MSRDWLALQCAYDGVEVPKQHVIITVNGTGSPDPFGPGFAGELGSQVDQELFFWQPVGYPAATFPMGPSVDVGVSEVVRLVPLYAMSAQWSGKIVLSGYSQGAMVVDKVWRDEILSPSGRLHALAQSGAIEVIGIVNFGDPMRAPGICNGNVAAGFPIPAPLDGYVTGGIAGPGDLTPAQTPPFLMSCNNDGDLYGAAPVGTAPWTQQTGVGLDETLIFNIVQNFDVANIIAIVQEALAIIGISPGAINTNLITDLVKGVIAGGGGLSSVPSTGAVSIAHVVALVEALMNGGMFVASGFSPHGAYEQYMPAMVQWVNKVGVENA